MSHEMPLKRNAYIDLCRFIGAMVMLFHHTEKIGGLRIALGGWIFVEYFFILSGYYMTRHFENYEDNSSSTEKESVLYVINKAKRIFPYAVFGIVIDIIAQIGLGMISTQHISELVLELPLHLLFLKIFGLTHFDINGPLWFVSGLFYIMPLIVCLQLKFKEFYKSIGIWLFPLAMYTIMYTTHGHIQYWGKGWNCQCLMRAFAGITLGSLVYYLSEYYKKVVIDRRFARYIKAIEVITFSILVFLSFFTDCMQYEVPSVLLILVTLVITFSGHGNAGLSNSNVAVKLGIISMPMFCIHVPVFRMICWLCSSLKFGLRVSIAVVMVVMLAWVLVEIYDRKNRRVANVR